jgi:DNA-binding PucR family transcriptional regulator
MNASTAARQLHVHKNTLGYRLRRVEQLLGVNLRTPRDVAAVQLALMGLG